MIKLEIVRQKIPSYAPPQFDIKRMLLIGWELQRSSGYKRRWVENYNLAVKKGYTELAQRIHQKILDIQEKENLTNSILNLVKPYIDKGLNEAYNIVYNNNMKQESELKSIEKQLGRVDMKPIIVGGFVLSIFLLPVLKYYIERKKLKK